MTTGEGYNGWENYPTWCVNLWLSNDEGLYAATLDEVSSGLTYADDHPNVPTFWTQAQADVYCVADHLRRFVSDDLIPDLGASFPADLLGWAMDHVAWNEIASAWIETAREQ